MTDAATEAINDFHRTYPQRDVKEMFIGRLYDEAFAAVGFEILRDAYAPEHILVWAGYEAVKGIYPYE